MIHFKLLIGSCAWLLTAATALAADTAPPFLHPLGAPFTTFTDEGHGLITYNEVIQPEMEGPVHFTAISETIPHVESAEKGDRQAALIVGSDAAALAVALRSDNHANVSISTTYTQQNQMDGTKAITLAVSSGQLHMQVLVEHAHDFEDASRQAYPLLMVAADRLKSASEAPLR